ncbi:phosphoglycerate kinase [Candidatus Pelagibacter bacterium]|nr:phosphoglycerate kinase [Candidatus Pelagibacter bacterium]|tara:strand:+ start:22 stop:1212 length:1191 start_codon:yes stop_codon:yes gene_type:complete
MDKINFFPDNLDIQNKKIILRLDFNVPLKDKIITDDTRITLCLPFLKKLIKKKAKIIIISHLGRPKGIRNPALSLMPIYKYLKKTLQTNVFFFMGNFDDKVNDKFSHLKEGEVILTENIRYFKEETNDDENFSRKLASLGDIYINDAFSCSHRKQSSIHKITKFVDKSFAGPLLKKEIDAINLVIKNKKKPVTCIIGGSKISTKINVITSLIEKINNLVIVGAMANNFLIYKNFKIGKSLIENNTKEIIEKIYDNVKKNNCEIIIPVDCVVGTSFEGEGKNRDLDQIEENEIILDIGYKTVNNIKQIINQSRTVLWNGPAGYFENKNFLNGTMSIAETISKNTQEKSLISVLGGGDTLAAINKSKNKLYFSHLSTAGGAFLEYLEGKDLPGLSVLK